MEKEDIKEIAKEIANEVWLEKKDELLKRKTFEFDSEGIKEGTKSIEKILLKKASNDFEREVQSLNDDVYILSKLFPEKSKIKLLKSYKQLIDLLKKDEECELAKAMTTTTVGAGAEWVPTGFSADLIDKIRLGLNVAKLHLRIDMPTDPFERYGLKKFAEAKLATQGTTVTSTTLGTRKYTLTSAELVTWVPVTYTLEEDSIIPILPTIKIQIVQSLVDAIEQATINGDKAATHLDSDVTATDDVRKAWNGYRKLALAAAKVDFGGAVVSATNLRNVRKAMGLYGASVDQLAWVVGVSGYNQILNLTEKSTVDKFGPMATVLTGEVLKWDGIPVVLSGYVREDLNASGVYDGVTKNRTIVILVRKDGFEYGDRRKVMVEVNRDVKARIVDLVASQRVAFSPRYDETTERIVGIGYNILS